MGHTPTFLEPGLFLDKLQELNSSFLLQELNSSFLNSWYLYKKYVPWLCSYEHMFIFVLAERPRQFFDMLEKLKQI
jgi:hypothetical protein